MDERPAGAPRAPFAWFDGVLADDLVEIADLSVDAAPLDRGGWWVVVGMFEGTLAGFRFARRRRAPLPDGSWVGPTPSAWTSSLDETGYLAKVRAIQQEIAAGRVYQVNLCRMLGAPDVGEPPAGLAARLQQGNPAPHAGVLDLGRQWVVSASPELFLQRNGDLLVSSPIKGTAAPGEEFLAKDVPENVMITDLMRNDLGRLAIPGTVGVTGLLQREHHPGIDHLVSTVSARIRPGLGWTEILTATFPPGSVSGAPKHTALQVISALESVPRGVYCGTFGTVDADAGTAKLAVAIRTFASDGTTITFGTGAGITWGSDPAAEWRETELKAERLIALASAPLTGSAVFGLTQPDG